MGVILTTYKSWDDPPSVGHDSWRKIFVLLHPPQHTNWKPKGILAFSREELSQTIDIHWPSPSKLGRVYQLSLVVRITFLLRLNLMERFLFGISDMTFQGKICCKGIKQICDKENYTPENERIRPLKRDYFSREYIFQPLIFRGHSLVFRGVTSEISWIKPN